MVPYIFSLNLTGSVLADQGQVFRTSGQVKLCHQHCTVFMHFCKFLSVKDPDPEPDPDPDVWTGSGSGFG